MSDKELWAVYLDYGLAGEERGIVHTTPLGGSIGSRDESWNFLFMMAPDAGENSIEERGMWEVDEDDLPFGYTFQTYYVARYFPEESK